MTRTMLVAQIELAIFITAFSAAAQTNAGAPPVTNSVSTADKTTPVELREQLRTKLIAGRRSICGKILRIFPEGILVESGYTNLLRAPLTKSWLVPGSVVASRAENLVETTEPGTICVGMVFLSDLPRGMPRQYDYVIIAGYPAGEFTYASVGTVKKTVRCFSANLDKTVKEDPAKAQGITDQTVR